MKSSSSAYLLTKGTLNPHSKLTIKKQSSIQKGSMHLTPIIKITPSKTINFGSNQKRLKIVSVSKRQQLKLGDQEKNISSTQTKASQIHLITNNQNKTGMSKTEYSVKNRSISKNISEINEDEKIVSLMKNIQIENEQKQFIIHRSEQNIKENTLQSNQSICINKQIFNNKTVKMELLEIEGKLQHLKNDNLYQRPFNSMAFHETNQSINSKNSIYSSLDIYPKIILEKDQRVQITYHQKTKLLCLESNIINYKRTDFCRQVQSPSNILSITYEYENQKLMHLQAIKKTLGQQTKLLQQSRSTQFYLQLEIKKKQLQLQQLQSKLIHVKEQVLNLNKQYEIIVNFSRIQENNKILKMISKDYLQIQSEIYDYAVYLQSNQLANDINFEPRPFSEIQRLISQREQHLKEILSDHGKGNIDKSVMMSEFISETMRLLKKKDSEMQKLSNFRAKCVLEFVSKMKKWLNNWQLKQEYLRNIKIQFVATLILLRNQMFTLEEKICEKELSLQKMNKIANINEMIDKMELSFKLGNSFY